MTRRPTEAEIQARERAIEESLDAVARLHARVDVEDRVMAMVRLHAARHPRRAGLSPRQKFVLGGAGAAAAAGEIAFWAALVLAVLGLPDLAATRAAVGSLPGASALAGVGEVAAALARAGVTVVEGLSLLLPSPAVMAGAFVTVVSLLTFIAVRRDLQRSPAARGLS